MALAGWSSWEVLAVPLTRVSLVSREEAGEILAADDDKSVQLSRIHESREAFSICPQESCGSIQRDVGPGDWCRELAGSMRWVIT